MSSKTLAAVVLSVSMLPLDAAAAVLRCGPYSRPVVRTVRVGGRLVEQVTCVSRPGVYYTPAARRVVVNRQIHRAPRYHGSWKKTALVIGGATAAGAGVGALVGGGKGAAIGAAAGAAGGTIYEVHKRRKHHRVVRRY